MKPAAFEYHNPSTVSEALELMAQFGDQARPLAGGQSLVPLMNFRLIRPAHLIDLNGVPELSYLNVSDDELRIGATTRQRQLERSREIIERWPLLRQAAGYIGHVQIRNRGTVGGSIAHAFPAAELPVAVVTLGASLVLRKRAATRLIPAEEFFLSHMTTVLEPDELLVEIRVPELPPRTGWSFQEVSRRYGDFALAAAAALLTFDAAGAIAQARLTFTGAMPIRAVRAEEALLGEKPSQTLFREVSRRAAEALDQDSDIHASAEYRRRVCAVMAERACAEAAQRAGKSSGGDGR